MGFHDQIHSYSPSLIQHPSNPQLVSCHLCHARAVEGGQSWMAWRMWCLPQCHKPPWKPPWKSSFLWLVFQPFPNSRCCFWSLPHYPDLNRQRCCRTCWHKRLWGDVWFGNLAQFLSANTKKTCTARKTRFLYWQGP